MEKSRGLAALGMEVKILFWLEFATAKKDCNEQPGQRQRPRKKCKPQLFQV